jgi:outer membrane protein
MKLWLVLLLIVSSLGAKEHILTIDDLVKIALEKSPDIDSSRLDFEGAKQRTRAAEGGYLPRLDLYADGGEAYTKFKHQPSEGVHLLAGELSASQLLYDFGRTAGRIGRSREEAMALEAQMQQVIADKILTVKKRYYDVLKVKSLIDVQQKNVALQREQLHRAKRYLLAGIKTVIDVSDAEVRLESAQLELKNAQYELELQRAKLEESLGVVPYGGAYRLYRKKLEWEKLSGKLPRVATPLSKLEAFAYRHRYLLQSSKHVMQSAVSGVEEKRGAYYPVLSLDAGYGLQHVDAGVVGVTPETQGKIGVSMQWNLFSGYQTEASVQEAKIALLHAASQIRSVKLAVKREVLEAHIAVRKSKENVKLSESIAKASLKKFGQAQKRYENELSDYVELQDAQQGYIRALSELSSAYYDYFISLAQLDHAIGR